MDTAQYCERVLRTFWRHAPVNASFLGVHEYDGLLARYDADSLAERRDELREHLRELDELRSTGPPLSAEERLDLALLEGELKTSLRAEEELRVPFRNPGSYLEEASYGVYLLMMRDFAPAEERARSAIHRLEEVPRLLEEARRNLSHPEEVPPLWAEMSSDATASAGKFFLEAIRWAEAEAPSGLSAFRSASDRAREAVQRFEHFLAERVRPRARGNYAVGREMFEFLLRESHGVVDSASELEAF